jgi:hypothetical protein
MNDILIEKHIIREFPQKQIPNLRFRKLVYAIEAKIKSMPGALGKDPFPLTHSFAEGVYIREVIIPKGYLCVGALHKHNYLNCIMSGDMSILTEEGIKRVKGPCWNVAPDGTKRLGYSHEDTIWITVHPNPDNLRDIEKLEEIIHAKDYDDLPDKIIDIGESKELNSLIEMALNTFDVNKFRELTKTIYAHEKDGFWSDWTKEQQDLYMSGDWEVFSRSRGYTEDEISDLRDWIKMLEDGEKNGFNPLEMIRDLSIEQASKNIKKDTRGEIMLSSHIPSSKKIPYKYGGELCQR